jgi:hypothetical protein
VIHRRDHTAKARAVEQSCVLLSTAALPDGQSGRMGNEGDERPDPADVAVSLRAVLAAVDAGELTAGQDQAAWLRGAVDALTVVAARDE